MKEQFTDPKTIDSIEKLEQEVEKVFLLSDRGVVKMVTGVIIANRMMLDPLWILFVAPPSGGKTEMILMTEALDFVFPVDDLTVNTFASGQKKTGKETSLLLKINNGIITFKDFTSILGKNKEARSEILKQLRQIFDGKYTKRTGTGDDITWTGKVGALAGCTDSIYSYLSEFSDMGDRFIMYSIEQPDRLEQSRRMLDNAEDMGEKRAHLQACFTHYANYVLNKLEDKEVELDKETKEQLLGVADFATRARSAVKTDFKSGLVTFVPTPEMPARMTNQLFTLASAFVAINKANPYLPPNHPAHSGKITEDEVRLLFKTAFDSIPRQRRDAIFPLAQFKQGVTTTGLATRLELPTDSVRKFLQEVNALGICSRKRHSGKQGDLWVMKDKWRNIMLNIERFEVQDAQLQSDNDDDDLEDDSWATFDAHQGSQEAEAEPLDPRL